MSNAKEKICNFFKVIRDFLSGTDIEVSVKNPTVEGTVSKSKNSIMVGVDQDGTKTNLEYTNNKVKVSHETVAKNESDDSESS
jgi:hypothetical protein